MSIDSVVRSLAPIGAEDETLRNTQSVPAMLKLSKDLLGRHLTVLDQVVSHFSVEDKLSTVMGTLENMSLTIEPETSSHKLLEGFDSLRSTPKRHRLGSRWWHLKAEAIFGSALADQKSRRGVKPTAT